MSNDKINKMESAAYDQNIVPAETAARKEREGDNFKQVSSSKGTTVDSEGLANNYAIEPEMYVNEPGDLQNNKDS